MELKTEFRHEHQEIIVNFKHALFLQGWIQMDKKEELSRSEKGWNECMDTGKIMGSYI